MLFTVAIAANAQKEMSPYSKYGYGILSDNASGSQRAMGGVGYAMNNGRQINGRSEHLYRTDRRKR